MGTSTNRLGISPATPLLPDWLDEVDNIDDGILREEDEPKDFNQDDEGALEDSIVPDDNNPNIPINRFNAGQREFQKAVRTGDMLGLSRAVKTYYRHSLGGPRRAAKRMQSSSRAVARLGFILNNIQQQGLAPVLAQYNLDQYAGRPVVEVLSALMDAVCGTSSLLDNAVTKYAYSLAVVRVIDENPTLDLSSLTGAQVAEMMAVFLEESLVYRLICDIGRSLTVATSDPAQSLKIEEQLSQIVSGLIRSTIVPELREALQDAATIERKLTHIYQIAVQTILNS